MYGCAASVHHMLAIWIGKGTLLSASATALWWNPPACSECYSPGLSILYHFGVKRCFTRHMSMHPPIGAKEERTVSQVASRLVSTSWLVSNDDDTMDAGIRGRDRVDQQVWSTLFCDWPAAVEKNIGRPTSSATPAMNKLRKSFLKINFSTQRAASGSWASSRENSTLIPGNIYF